MGGWGESVHGWQRVRRREANGVSCAGGRWTAPDLAIIIGAFAIRVELGLAFLALKLWQQASGTPGSLLGFARSRWEGLVAGARSILSGASIPSLHVGVRSSGNHAFDSWRQTELTRIEAEREKLRAAEREFAAYRDELLHAKDREDFDRFMQSRTGA